ncbi:MAG: UDP-N-acetylmuramate--L-alanine ligase [Patescibacteria group bacterium]|nr:UDP-N-acetylmuramate--L-alanine ligase [Patescibacteria group bacterium]
MDLKYKKIYFIGIEGAGTSALAQIYKKFRCEVSGSDNGDHFYGKVLKKAKIKVYKKFNKKNLPQKIDLVVYGTSFKDDNPEIKEAKKRNLKLLPYPMALAEIFNKKFGIAVCGTHGKTTITAMSGLLLEKARFSPTVLVGSLIKNFNGNALFGKSEYFILEADEYQNKLRYYKPKIVILNNINFDHPDFFPTIKEYKSAFKKFVKKLGKDCVVIANFDDKNVKLVIKGIKAKVISFGKNSGKITYEMLSGNNEKNRFNVFVNKKKLGIFELKILGEHNVLNSLPFIALSQIFKIDLKIVKKTLIDFAGAERRMQKKGRFKNFVIYDDYAHHPAEIKATISAIKQNFQNRKIWAVFHPHSFSRTEALLDDFAKSFNLADRIIILDIYGSARENSGTIHSLDLVKKINKNFPNKALYIPTIQKAANFLKKNLSGSGILITMGAGDVWRVAEKLVNFKNK